MSPQETLDHHISEYLELVRGSSSDEQIKKKLVSQHDWTHEGAEALLELVNNYGSFMLSNALALAVVRGREDGDLGF